MSFISSSKKKLKRKRQMWREEYWNLNNYEKIIEDLSFGKLVFEIEKITQLTTLCKDANKINKLKEIKLVIENRIKISLKSQSHLIQALNATIVANYPFHILRQSFMSKQMRNQAIVHLENLNNYLNKHLHKPKDILTLLKLYNFCYHQKCMRIFRQLLSQFIKASDRQKQKWVNYLQRIEKGCQNLAIIDKFKQILERYDTFSIILKEFKNHRDDIFMQKQLILQRFPSLNSYKKKYFYEKINNLMSQENKEFSFQSIFQFYYQSQLKIRKQQKMDPEQITQRWINLANEGKESWKRRWQEEVKGQKMKNVPLSGCQRHFQCKFKMFRKILSENGPLYSQGQKQCLE